MELIRAVREEDWERVKVRRPLEAVSGTEYGPSRGVCMGLGQWILEAFRRTPDSALLCRVYFPASGPLGFQTEGPSGNCDIACRRSSVPVTTSRSVTCTLPCHIAESHNLSPPPSPAIAVSATF